jgi:hypothetical protein
MEQVPVSPESSSERAAAAAAVSLGHIPRTVNELTISIILIFGR